MNNYKTIERYNHDQHRKCTWCQAQIGCFQLPLRAPNGERAYLPWLCGDCICDLSIGLEDHIESGLLDDAKLDNCEERIG